jgi:hypothetical protein
VFGNIGGTASTAEEQVSRDVDANRVRQRKEEEDSKNKAATISRLEGSLEQWETKGRGDVRTLLQTLHLVAWEDSGWVKPSPTDLLNPSGIKKAYRQVLRRFHPDRLKKGTTEMQHIVAAERIFTVVNKYYKKSNEAPAVGGMQGGISSMGMGGRNSMGMSLGNRPMQGMGMSSMGMNLQARTRPTMGHVGNGLNLSRQKQNRSPFSF